MNKFFALDNPVWNFLGKVWDVFWITILWIVCSIPVVTFGASTAAFYYVGLKLVKNEEGYVTRQFFHSFKQNLKQGSIIGILVIVLGVLLVFNVRFYAGMDSTMYKALFILMLAIGWVYVMIVHYIFAALAQFHNTIKGLILFSFAVSIRKLGWTILMLVINIVIILATFVFFPLILAVPGLIVVTNCSIISRCFKPYIEQAEEKMTEIDV